MNNFTASYLKHFNRKILDEVGNDILTINYNNKILPYKYSRPKIYFNILEKTKPLKKPIMRLITMVAEIKKLGYVVCSVPVATNEKWFKMQRIKYVLFKEGSIEERSSSKPSSMFGAQLKEGHAVEHDEANGRVRLVGPKSGPMGEGPWLQLG